ncbi:MAG: hypothetical protein ACM37Z_01035 [Deltaproteobacteria bacterium]
MREKKGQVNCHSMLGIGFTKQPWVPLNVLTEESTITLSAYQKYYIKDKNLLYHST